MLLNNGKFPCFMLKALELHLFCLTMHVAFCFNNLFSHDTPMHRKWVRLKCVGYLFLDALFLDALFHFIYIYIYIYIYISYVSIFGSFEPNLKALNKSTCWEITQEFCRVLKVITSINRPLSFLFWVLCQVKLLL